MVNTFIIPVPIVDTNKIFDYRLVITKPVAVMNGYYLVFFNLLSLSFLFLSILSGCNKNVSNLPLIEQHYDLYRSEEGGLKDIFESVELIPLQYKEQESYPSSVSKFLAQDSLILVADNKNLIHVFDKEGTFISSSANIRGEGPGEVSIINSFTYDPNTKSIAILTPFKIMEYDNFFNFINEYPIPSRIKSKNQSELLFNKIDRISDNYILFTNTRDGKSLRFMKFNKESHETEDEIEYSDKIFGFGSFQNKNFFNIESQSAIFIPTALCNQIFLYDYKKNSLTPIVSFSLGEKESKPDEFNSFKNINQAANDFLKSNKEVVVRVLPNNEYIIFMTKSGDNLKTFANYVVNRRTGDIRKILMFEDGKMISPMFQDIDSDYVYAIMEKENLIEAPILLMDKVEDLNSIEDESLVVLKYKFKSLLD